MTTFTVYCHGTGFNRAKGTESDELVAWFHNHTNGVEARLSGSLVSAGDYMINEGPGHGGAGGIAQAQNVNPISGDAKVNRPLSKRLNPFTSPSFADHASGNTGGPAMLADARGKIGGQGWDENVIRTVNVIQDLKFEKNIPIDRVNLVGWSRGAVTCIRIAHRLYELFNDSVVCNIFAADPVAGSNAGVKMLDTRILQPNVRNYISVLAMHEMRETFKPQDWSRLAVDPAMTTTVLLPMPGVHNAQVMVKTPPDSAYITRNLAAGFLRSVGTVLTNTPYAHLNSSQDMCEAYGRLVLSLSEHAAYQSAGIGSRAVGMGLRRRAFAKHSMMDSYTRGGKESYWINEHHRACFEDAFPLAYNIIFESIGNGTMRVSDADAQLSAALVTRSGIRNSLAAKGLLAPAAAGGGYEIGIGAGRYADHRRAIWPPEFPLHA